MELGSQRITSGRRRGRQEQMMPTLVSTELHVAAGGLSYVGSEELEMATSDRRRSMETRHTLQAVSKVFIGDHARFCACNGGAGAEDPCHVAHRTYKPPTAKIPIRAVFCRRSKFRLRMTGIGRMMIAKSVAMLTAAFVLYSCKLW